MLQQPTAAREKLAALHRRIEPQHSAAFCAALIAEATHRARGFVRGVQVYRQYPHPSSLRAMPVIWHRGSTCLRDYNPSHSHAPVVLVIPSLINRFTILDLDTDQSFLHWLAMQGFRPLVVDWGLPGEQEKDFSVGSYISERLVPLLQTIASQRAVHVLGYCMGGLLALALAVLQKERVRSLTLMATPWDFHQPNAARGAAFLALAPYWEPLLQQNQTLSIDMIQTLFALLQPLKVLRKFTAFADTASDSVAAKHFVRLEDWLNDGVPLTAPVVRECLMNWYGKNDPAQGRWSVANHRIDPTLIPIPSNIVVPSKDHIVPPESAAALAQVMPQALLTTPAMGHIGLMASVRAPQEIWMPLAAWLSKQN